MSSPITIVDLFAGGAGGWDFGARRAGLPDPIGVELDKDARDSRHLNGLPTRWANVADVNPHDFDGADGVIASPPCPDFSSAGKKAGLEGATGWLTNEVPRFVEAIRPRWVACEQVPGALHLWEAHAERYRALGYRTLVVKLFAEEYGVPQTRQRAILLAHRDRQPMAPTPTHQRFQGRRRGRTGRQPDLFLPAPVSMFEALAFTLPDGAEAVLDRRASATAGTLPVNPVTDPSPTVVGSALGHGVWNLRVGFARKDDLGTSPDGYRERDWRDVAYPAPTLTEKARSIEVDARLVGGAMAKATVRTMDEPAPTLLANIGKNGGWRWEGDHWRRQLTVEEALVLQTFPPDLALSGSRTSRFHQVGNAVPPRLAEVILNTLVNEGAP